MSIDLQKIEVERIVNLVAGFGWTKVKEEVVAGEVSLTLKKIIPEEKATAMGG